MFERTSQPPKGRGKTYSVQKRIHSCITGRILERNMWVPFINEKLAVLGATGTGELPVTCEVWCGLCQVMRKEPPQVATCFLKTVINSWYTTHRMGEVPRLSCIFGCPDKEDNLKHYLLCSPMWSLAVSACGLPLSFLSLDPIERLCIFNKSVPGLRLLSVAFRSYRAPKLNQRCLIDTRIANNDFKDCLCLSELW